MTSHNDPMMKARSLQIVLGLFESQFCRRRCRPTIAPPLTSRGVLPNSSRWRISGVCGTERKVLRWGLRGLASGERQKGLSENAKLRRPSQTVSKEEPGTPSKTLQHGDSQHVARDLTNQIRLCRTGEALCLLVRNRINQLDYIHVATAFHCLATLSKHSMIHQSKHHARSGGGASASSHNRAPGAGSAMTKGERLKAIEALSGRAVKLIDSFQARALSNVWWAFASMREAPSPVLLESLMQQSLATTDDFAPQTIANTLWSMARLRIPPNPDLLLALSTRAIFIAHEFQPQVLPVFVVGVLAFLCARACACQCSNQRHTAAEGARSSGVFPCRRAPARSGPPLICTVARLNAAETASHQSCLTAVIRAGSVLNKTKKGGMCRTICSIKVVYLQKCWMWQDRLSECPLLLWGSVIDSG